MVDPGIIKNKVQAKLSKKRYPYDEVMFKKEATCDSCNIEKPARSKHCRTCDHCVEKFDHHCIWLNQCVGRRNYKWFLSFLFLHILICIYGSFAGVAVFYGEMEKRNKEGVMFYNKVTGEKFKPTL